MIECYVAPTERPPFSKLGTVSSLPERYGVDAIWQTPHGMAGCQRKEVMDFVASVRDGRLGRELEQMRQLHTAVVCIEGQPSWDREGNLQSQHTRWTLKQQRGVVLSIQQQGVYVVTSRSSLETCEVVEHLMEWTNKTEHVSSLLARPGPSKNGWGRMTDRSTAIHILSGYPNISTELASRIFDHYGRVPCRHDVAEKSLTEVEGIGAKRAASIIKVLA